MILANMQEQYFQPNGAPTIDGMKLLQSYQLRLARLEQKLDAIGAVTAPTGGATADAEARAAINAIIAAA